jgi:hypothetical protein
MELNKIKTSKARSKLPMELTLVVLNTDNYMILMENLCGKMAKHTREDSNWEKYTEKAQ